MKYSFLFSKLIGHLNRLNAFLAICMIITLTAGCGTGSDASGGGNSSQSGDISSDASREKDAGDISDSGSGKQSGTESDASEGRGRDNEDDSNGDGGAESDGNALQVRILKVGKADAIILQCADRTMVIDCGEDEDGEEVLSFLKEHGVSLIDILLITHYDKDHVGGADTVAGGMPIARVLVPAYAGSSSEYEDFMSALKNAGVTPEEVTKTQKFELGASAVTVEPPSSYEIPNNGKEYDNDLSLITTVEFSGKRFVFTGDIEKNRIREWLAGGTAQKCDVLKVPHHGDYNKALEDLFDTLQPSYAVICDSDKNPAEEKTLDLIGKSGAECFETRNGDISITCTASGIEVYQG